MANGTEFMKATGWDLVGDVHGTLATLDALISRLGYRRGGRGWEHPEGRVLVSLGDLLDRGPDCLGSLERIQNMMADGVAHMVLGNHELNALHFMAGLRKDTPRNRVQFFATLRQIEADPKRWERAAAFLHTLPFSLNLAGGDLRVVHAYWDEALIDLFPDNLGQADALRRTAPGGDLFAAVESCLKGPEEPCEPWSDPEGNTRRRRRIRWWETYSESAPMVVFGHYWFPSGAGDPKPTAPLFLGPGGNAACLDWSAVRGGPLVALRWPERVFVLEDYRDR